MSANAYWVVAACPIVYRRKGARKVTTEWIRERLPVSIRTAEVRHAVTLFTRHRDAEIEERWHELEGRCLQTPRIGFDRTENRFADFERIANGAGGLHMRHYPFGAFRWEGEIPSHELQGDRVFGMPSREDLAIAEIVRDGIEEARAQAQSSADRLVRTPDGRIFVECAPPGWHVTYDSSGVRCAVTNEPTSRGVMFSLRDRAQAEAFRDRWAASLRKEPVGSHSRIEFGPGFEACDDYETRGRFAAADAIGNGYYEGQNMHLLPREVMQSLWRLQEIARSDPRDEAAAQTCIAEMRILRRLLSEKPTVQPASQVAAEITRRLGAALLREEMFPFVASEDADAILGAAARAP